jgi:hypothetical protein
MFRNDGDDDETGYGDEPPPPTQAQRETQALDGFLCPCADQDAPTSDHEGEGAAAAAAAPPPAAPEAPAAPAAPSGAAACVNAVLQRSVVAAMDAPGLSPADLDDLLARRGIGVPSSPWTHRDAARGRKVVLLDPVECLRVYAAAPDPEIARRFQLFEARLSAAARLILDVTLTATVSPADPASMVVALDVADRAHRLVTAFLDAADRATRPVSVLRRLPCLVLVPEVVGRRVWLHWPGVALSVQALRDRYPDLEAALLAHVNAADGPTAGRAAAFDLLSARREHPLYGHRGDEDGHPMVLYAACRGPDAERDVLYPDAHARDYVGPEVRALLGIEGLRPAQYTPILCSINTFNVPVIPLTWKPRNLRCDTLATAAPGPAPARAPGPAPEKTSKVEPLVEAALAALSDRARSIHAEMLFVGRLLFALGDGEECVFNRWVGWCAPDDARLRAELFEEWLAFGGAHVHVKPLPALVGLVASNAASPAALQAFRTAVAEFVIPERKAMYSSASNGCCSSSARSRTAASRSTCTRS